MITNLLKVINIATLDISSGYLWFGFGFVMLLVAIVSFVLVYHWVRYTVKKWVARSVIIIYFSGLIIIITFLIWGLNSYINSLI